MTIDRKEAKREAKKKQLIEQQRLRLEDVSEESALDNAELMVAKGTTTSSCTTKRNPKVTSQMPRQKEQISQATPNRFVV